MSIIPCDENKRLNGIIEEYAEALKVQAHTLGSHGLSEEEFYDSGVFRGAIERIRGQFSATMREKRDFVKQILNHMQDCEYIASWESTGGTNRHDYSVKLPSGKTAIIETKGCLDGNNTLIFERPPHANEFVIWSLCTNPGANPRRNAWSGINRLGAEIIFKHQHVDGLIIWDMVCGTPIRPCPKLIADPRRVTDIGAFVVPPPCVYLMPATVPSPRNNPHPPAQSIDQVEILKAFHKCFSGRDEELNFVDFEVHNAEDDIVRTTTVMRAGAVAQVSNATAIRRS